MKSPKHLLPAAAWRGRMVRSVEDMQTRGGRKFKAGSLFRVHQLCGGRFNLQQIDSRGRDVRNGFIRRVWWRNVYRVDWKAGAA